MNQQENSRTPKKELGALAIANIRRRGINFVGGVRGLGLNVTASGSRSWILRYKIAGVRRDMGLGGYPSVTLAQAKEVARAARAKLAQGIDPIEEAKAARSSLIAERASNITFREAAARYIAAHETSWRNYKHGQQWRNTLETYTYSLIGSLLVRDVRVTHVLQVLEPIWQDKTETANRLRGRIEQILDWSIARGYKTDSNPAKWKGLLDKLLPAPTKIARKVHHRALPYDELPALYQRLAGLNSSGASALLFLILTACRSGEVRGARWEEFDFVERIWTVPATRMKAGKSHRVPLSDAAMDLLQKQKEQSFSCYVFPSPNQSKGHAEGRPLSDMTLTAVLRRMDIDAVPHGFRSTFRDWCAETTDFPNEVAEMALAHTVANKVEAAYRRGDLLEKRRSLMQAWGKFVLE